MSLAESYDVHRVTLKRFLGRDKWGQNEQFSNHPIQGFLSPSTRLVQDANGERVRASSSFTVTDCPFTLTHEDFIVIDGIEHAILGTVAHRTLDDSVHEVLLA